MRRPISKQVVVITGASSGIGRCAAQRLASHGAIVVLTARRGEALAEVVREIVSSGGRALAIPGDVTREADMRAVADAAVERFGRIDTWVNNAGVYLQGRVLDTALDEYRRLLNVDFVGMVNGTQRALEVMLPRRQGVIVQVSSVAAKRGLPYGTAYSAAKSAIDGFTSALRAELWGSGVHLSIVYPPTVDTPIYHHGRGKLGVVPKPAPPLADPTAAAKAIEHLACTGRRYHYFGWAGPLAALDALSPALGDLLAHRGAGFTFSETPAQPDDNLHDPSRSIAPAVRAGWSDPGWKGVTLREVARVLPLESLLAAGMLGLIAGRATRKWRGGRASHPRLRD